jgi:DNA-binding Lrp family transcriptional regulator
MGLLFIGAGCLLAVLNAAYKPTNCRDSFGILSYKVGVMPHLLDDTDRCLLALLRDNARLSAADLARKLKLARTTVQSRLARLERERVIVGYTVVTPDEAEAALVRAHVLITAAPKQGAAIESALRRLPELRTLLSVSGPFDLIAVLAADSIGTLDALIDRIGALDGVERTTSAIVLSTRIAR